MAPVRLTTQGAGRAGHGRKLTLLHVTTPVLVRLLGPKRCAASACPSMQPPAHHRHVAAGHRGGALRRAGQPADRGHRRQRPPVALSGHGQGAGGMAVETAVCGEAVWEEESEGWREEEGGAVAAVHTTASRRGPTSVGVLLEGSYSVLCWMRSSTMKMSTGCRRQATGARVGDTRPRYAVPAGCRIR